MTTGDPLGASNMMYAAPDQMGPWEPIERFKSEAHLTPSGCKKILDEVIQDMDNKTVPYDLRLFLAELRSELWSRVAKAQGNSKVAQTIRSTYREIISLVDAMEQKR